MNLQPKAYRKKPYRVMAVLVTENNMDEVAEWCGGVIRHELVDENTGVTQRQLYVGRDGRVERAEPGHDVVYRSDVDNKWYVCDAKLFYDYYEEVFNDTTDEGFKKPVKAHAH